MASASKELAYAAENVSKAKGSAAYEANPIAPRLRTRGYQLFGAT